jgi:hypothetical protein
MKRIALSVLVFNPGGLPMPGISQRAPRAQVTTRPHYPMLGYTRLSLLLTRWNGGTVLSTVNTR